MDPFGGRPFSFNIPPPPLPRTITSAAPMPVSPDDAKALQIIENLFSDKCNEIQKVLMEKLMELCEKKIPAMVANALAQQYSKILEELNRAQDALDQISSKLELTNEKVGEDQVSAFPPLSSPKVTSGRSEAKVLPIQKDLSPLPLIPEEAPTVEISDEETQATISDVEMEVFGKSLTAPSHKAADSDTDDDMLSNTSKSKAGRKRGSKNKGPTKQELLKIIEDMKKSKRDKDEGPAPTPSLSEKAETLLRLHSNEVDWMTHRCIVEYFRCLEPESEDVKCTHPLPGMDEDLLLTLLNQGVDDVALKTSLLALLQESK